MTIDQPFTLDESYAGFIESGVRIVAASRDVQNRPLIGLCVGCRVAPVGSTEIGSGSGWYKERSIVVHVGRAV
jgi:hypothetical protein